MQSHTVTPALIKELRERTGVGMAKCKEALEETKGDMEAAIDLLRKSGIASAVKKSGREANEGVISFGENSSTIAIFEANAETDFVLQNDMFKSFVKNIAEELLLTKPSSVEAFLQQTYSKEPSLTIDHYRSTIVQAIGENILLKRIHLVTKQSDYSYGIYSHMGGKILTMIEMQGAGEENLAREIAIHTAAAAPEYLSPQQVPQSVQDYEKEIARSQIVGKPDHIADKIIEGKLNAFFDATCLVKQKFVKDNALCIIDLVHKQEQSTGKKLEIVRFLRWKVGQA